MIKPYVYFMYSQARPDWIARAIDLFRILDSKEILIMYIMH
jgi:hypothetical protein